MTDDKELKMDHQTSKFVRAAVAAIGACGATLSPLVAHAASSSPGLGSFLQWLFGLGS